MENSSNTIIARRTPLPALGSFAVVLISLGVLLYTNGVNVFGVLLVVSMGVGLLLLTALAWRSSFQIALFLLLIFVIVLTPPLPPFFGTASWRIYQVVLVVLAPFIIFWRRRVTTWLDAWIAVFGSTMILSMLMGFISGNPPVLSDWFELAKPGFWWLIFSFSLGLGWRLELKERGLWIFLGAGVVGGLLTLAQRQNWGDVNGWLTPLFIINEKLISNVGVRVAGTFVSPTQQATFMVTVLNVAVVLRLFSQRQTWLQRALVLYACGAFTIVLMTGSKFGLLASTLSVFGIVLIRLWFTRISSLYKLLLTGSLVLVVALAGTILMAQAYRVSATWLPREIQMANPLTATLYRLGGIQDDLDPNALRISDWRKGWELGMAAPIFGQGPSKGIDELTYFHSEYVLVFRRYGFMGLLAFLFLYGSVALSAYRSFREAQTRQDAQQQVVALSTLVSVLIFAIDGIFSNGALSDFQLSAVLWWLIGLFYGSTVASQTRKDIRVTFCPEVARSEIGHS